MRITSLLLSRELRPLRRGAFSTGVAEECSDFDGELRVMLEQEPVRHGGVGFRFV
jgi:hypothetical protein